MNTTTALHLVPTCPHWPRELREIEGPPAELWLRGRLEWLEAEPRVAIVGTRAPTAYGESQAVRFARALSAAGCTVVSGLARGVDQAAHRAVLELGGRTIAVLGSGVDRPWPEGELTARMASEGLLLSEFHPGEAPRPHHFPLRNRVISALSRAVVVIEAAHASGSLITARWAVDQGRSVFALPGRVDHPMSRGAHKLIREGAQLVEDPEEILEDLGLSGALPLAKPPHAEPADPRRTFLLAALRGETLSSEELSRALAWPQPQVLVELVECEMAGQVRRLPGGRYQLLDPR
ncbi:MAG: DNA-protecting protein DprA [Planctomycetes bacterium]|nr:DNA-protecting protein DprA [Planctomycetota bacterium]